MNKERNKKLNEITSLSLRVHDLKVMLINETMSMENFMLNYMRMREAEVRLSVLKDEVGYEEKPTTIIRKYPRHKHEYVRTKCCAICREVKRTSQFNYLPAADDYHSYCRPCLSVYNKMKYRRNK